MSTTTTKVLLGLRNAWVWQVVLVAACLLLYAQDLSAPLSGGNPYRQCQTAMLTKNFANEGFSLNGLHPDFFGAAKPVMIFECPVYNLLSGLMYKAGGNLPLCGKLVSLLAGCAALIVLFRLVATHYGATIGGLAGLFFILSPGSMLHLTAFQPDAFGLTCILLSLLALMYWRASRRPVVFVGFCLCLLLGGLAKYPLLVPYLPIIMLGWFEMDGRFRRPAVWELLAFAGLFVVPFVAWQAYRGSITDPMFGSASFNVSMFLIGDLRRFLSAAFYTTVLRDHFIRVASGAGIIFLILGARRMGPVMMALMAGVPLYYVVVPTVWQQNYYLFACAPIYALLMACGVSVLWTWRNQRLAALALVLVSVLFIAASIVKWRQRFTPDKALDAAAYALKTASRPSDMVLWVWVNDADVVGNIRDNPTMFFLAERRGWNVGWGEKLEGVVSQIEAKKREGARWLVVTKDDPTRLGVFEGVFRPKAALQGEGKRIYDELQHLYPVIQSGPYYGVMSLGTSNSKGSAPQ